MSNTIQVFLTRVLQPSGSLVRSEWAREQILEKEHPQGFDWFLCQRR
jgi:hypothetical protein